MRVNEIARGNPECVLYIIEFPFYMERESERGIWRRSHLPFVIAGIYKQYSAREYALCRGFPKRNMVIRAMAHIDMNDARH